MPVSTFCFKTRGYELDSFGHVNNAVYLNYLEEARWELLQSKGLIDFFTTEKYFLVVTDCHIKYKHELQLHTEAEVLTSVSFESPYVVFEQKIVRKNPSCTFARARVKTLLIDEQRAVVGEHNALKVLYANND